MREGQLGVWAKEPCQELLPLSSTRTHGDPGPPRSSRSLRKLSHPHFCGPAHPTPLERMGWFPGQAGVIPGHKQLFPSRPRWLVWG